jgi:hypothetical protein
VNSERPSPLAPLAVPFALKIVICFLILDVAERLIQMGLLFFQNEIPWTLIFVFCLWIFIDVLLIALVVFRTTAGRIWVLIVFGVHLFYVGYTMIHESPSLWLGLDAWDQTRILSTLAIDALGMHLCCREDVSEYLTD